MNPMGPNSTSRASARTRLAQPSHAGSAAVRIASTPVAGKSAAPAISAPMKKAYSATAEFGCPEIAEGVVLDHDDTLIPTAGGVIRRSPRPRVCSGRIRAAALLPQPDDHAHVPDVPIFAEHEGS
jgi:hypothetical protein